MADFFHPHLFDAPARGVRLEFLDETCPIKTISLDVWGYRMAKIS